MRRFLQLSVSQNCGFLRHSYLVKVLKMLIGGLAPDPLRGRPRNCMTSKSPCNSSARWYLRASSSQILLQMRSPPGYVSQNFPKIFPYPWTLPIAPGCGKLRSFAPENLVHMHWFLTQLLRRIDLRLSGEMLAVVCWCQASESSCHCSGSKGIYRGEGMR